MPRQNSSGGETRRSTGTRSITGAVFEKHCELQEGLSPHSLSASHQKPVGFRVRLEPLVPRETRRGARRRDQAMRQ
jgi:hypothetical protein